MEGSGGWPGGGGADFQAGPFQLGFSPYVSAVLRDKCHHHTTIDILFIQ